MLGRGSAEGNAGRPIGQGRVAFPRRLFGLVAIGVAGVALLSGAVGATPPSSAITYGYDELGRLVAVSDPAHGAAKYSFDAVGNLLSITRQATSVVSILSFSPKQAPVGATVTIYGTGFSATASQDTVKFNGTVASVSSATATQLLVTVPAGASNGTISVTAPGGTATSSGSFSVGPTGPSISNFVPAVAAVGDALTVNGANFDATPANDVVAVGAARAQTGSATVTSIATTVPAGTGSGKLRVLTPSGKAVASGDLFIPPPPHTAADVGFTSRIAIGDTTTVTIGTASKLALVLFDGIAGQRVFVNFTNDTIAGGACCHAQASLLNPDGTTLSGPRYIEANPTDLDTVTLPLDGTYTLFLDPGPNTGSVTMTLYNVPADVAPTLNPSASGSAATLTVSTPGQNMAPTFTGTAGERIFVNFTNDTIAGGNCCNTKASLLNPDGTTLSGPRYIEANPTDLDTVTLPVAGTYTILIDPPGALTGSVTVTAYAVPADPAPTLSPSASGSAATMSVSTPGQNMAPTFTGTAGERIFVQFTSNTFNGGNCCHTQASLIGPPPNNTVVTGPTFADSNPNSFYDAVTLPADGSYTILVDPYGADTGSITVTAYAVPADQQLSMTVGGPSLPVSISTPGQSAFVTFSSTNGKTLHLSFTQSFGSYDVYLNDPNGQQLAHLCCGGTSTTVTGTADGSYQIKVDPYGPATGSMTLTLTDPPAPDLFAAGSSLIATPFLDRLLASVKPSRSERRAALLSAPEQVGAAHAVRGDGRFAQQPAPPNFNPPDPEEWTPAGNALHGDWRTGRPETPLTQLPPLQASFGITALAGQVLTLNGRPLANVSLHLANSTLRTNTDDTGRFLLDPVPAGHRVLIVDGKDAGTAGKRYGLFEIGVDIAAEKTNVLTYTIWMPKLDTAHSVSLSSPTSSEVVVTTPHIPGLELHLQPGTVIKDEDGNPVTNVSITAVPVDRPPFPLPLGVTVPLYFTIQPGGAYLSKPAELVYPNYTHLPPGQRVPFWNYDPDKKDWYIYGQGTVSQDASQVVPDPDTRIWAFTGAMITGSPTPPGIGPKDHTHGGDPVDLGTGLFVYQKTDLVEPGPAPLALTRTYRQGDANSYSFGIGTTMPYELRLWSVNNYQSTELILPDGGRVHYVRISAGTGFTDAVYQAQTTPTVFYMSKIAWNGNGWNLTLKDGTVYVFGENTPLQSIRDRFGNQITLTRAFGSFGNITQLTALPSGRWIKFSYDGSGRVIQAQDSAGRSVSYAYDGSGRLQTVTDAKGGITTLSYNAANQMTSIKDPRNITYLTVDYDANGRVMKQTQADTSTYQFSYTADGNGNVTQTDVTDPLGNVRRVAFNADGYSTSEIDALGKPEQETTSYERQTGTDLITATVDPLNRRSEFAYDSLGNLMSRTRLAGTSNAVATTFTYEPKFNQLKTVTDPLNHTTTYGYEARGALTSIKDALNHTTTIAPNGAGQPTQVSDALNETTSFGYVLGDLISVSDPLGNTTSRFIDNAGRLGSVIDPLGDKTAYQYDPLNEPTTVTDPKSGPTSFAYDGNGNLLTLTDPLNHATAWTYDSMDRPATRKDALLHQETYAYDGNGNLTSFTDRKSQRTTFQYDALNRRARACFGSTGTPPNDTCTSTITYTYDAGDRLLSAVDSLTGTITDSYDGLDRLTQEVEPKGTLSYTYDSADRRATMTVAGQPQVSYGYDAADRLTSLTQGSASVAIAYDDANRRTSLTLPDGIVEQYAYDNASQLSSITYKLGASTLGDLNYASGPDGNRTAVWGAYARTGLPTAATSNTYNAANQLTKWANKSTTNDANGSLTNDSLGQTYTWNNRGQLTSTAKSGTNVSYSYDAFGRRLTKTVNSTTTGSLYDGVNLVQELSGSTPTANLITGNHVDEIYRRTDSNGARDFLTDALGSTIALADANGTVQTSYTYEPFGKTSTSGTANANSLQYTGREQDANGLLELRARYYSPTLQRFLSEDPIGLAGGDANLYAYSGNTPIMSRDPSGTCTISSDPKVIIGECFGRIAQGAAAISAAARGGILPAPTSGLILGGASQLVADLLHGGYPPSELGQRMFGSAGAAAAAETFAFMICGTDPFCAVPVGLLGNLAGRKFFFDLLGRFG